MVQYTRGDIMPSKKEIAYRNKYNAEHYDTVHVKLPRGGKQEMLAHISMTGETMNGFIKRSIKETMERDVEKECRK